MAKLKAWATVFQKIKRGSGLELRVVERKSAYEWFAVTSDCDVVFVQTRRVSTFSAEPKEDVAYEPIGEVTEEFKERASAAVAAYKRLSTCEEGQESEACEGGEGCGADADAADDSASNDAAAAKAKVHEGGSEVDVGDGKVDRPNVAVGEAAASDDDMDDLGKLPGNGISVECTSRDSDGVMNDKNGKSFEQMILDYLDDDKTEDQEDKSEDQKDLLLNQVVACCPKRSNAIECVL